MMKAILFVVAVLALEACASADDVATKPVDPAVVTMVSQGALIVDVRTPDEFSGGHYPDAVNVPHDSILEGLKALDVASSDPIVLYCRSGNRSGQAETTLRAAGYDNAHNAGGLAALMAATKAEPSKP